MSTNKSPILRKHKQAVHWLCHDDGLGIGAKKNWTNVMCDQSNEKRENKRTRDERA